MESRNSLERVIALLDVFSEDHLEWTPDALMARLGYSRPTLYRYLKSLKDAGFLTTTPAGGYTLGPRVVELDFLMRKSDVLVQRAEPHLEALAKAYPCNSLLVRWYGNKLLCVASECSTDDVQTSYPRGRPMALARGAISRSIIAFLPRRKLLPFVDANLDELRATGLGASREEILDAMRQIRRTGYAVAYGEVTPGVTGIAAPIFDSGSSPIASLCLTISQEAASRFGVTELGAALKRSAGEISDYLAHRRAEGEASHT
ncbi:IclR family transcriptional regulator [Amorphus sp. 3PC139-8]|uniref:IclR family transcriptional regulator n=1 Tax=Amorphus sp. 3PC139-8 TaxID=2735676 RepID=UPI00345D5F20